MTGDMLDFRRREFWEWHAEEIRQLASTIKTPELKSELEFIARGYDMLARHAARLEALGLMLDCLEEPQEA